ncbi:MAG: Extracellular solute-binding protein [Deltaproteobacteria bacterium]|nr:Extracellular solute-binding protein [Deltaproteobacteria bacterium]
MKTRLCSFVLLLAILFGLSRPTPCSAATVQEVIKKLSALAPAQRKKALEDGARQEGQFVFYTSVSVQDNPRIMAAFEKAFPYVKTDVYRGTPRSAFLKAATEARAGRHAVDIVGTAPVEMWQLKQAKLSTGYSSPELQAMPKGSYDPEGYWAAFEVTPIVVAFQTKLLRGADIPNNYQDLLNPKYKGKMNLGTEEYDWFSVMLDSMGQDKGLAYMRALAKQDLHLPGPSSRMRVQLMLAGESAIALAARARRVTDFKEQGAPIDFRIFDPYAGEPNSLAMMARAPHPHAAILFTDYLLSQEGQVMLADIPRLSIRKGVKQKGRLQDLFVKDFTFVNPASYGANTKQLIDQFNQIFGIRS